jgi:hypothetical protein
MTKNKPPKYSIDKGKQKAYIRINGAKSYLPGKSNSPESKAAYARFEVEWWQNAQRPTAERVPASPTTSGAKSDTTVKEIALAFLQYAEATKSPLNLDKYQRATMDFLVALYGSTPVADFNVGCLHTIREAILQSRRFCRKGINDYVRRIVTLFKWGVSIGKVEPMVTYGLETVKPLEEGYPGTFDHPEREYVKDGVIWRTLPLLPPILQAMIKLQRLVAMRPIEVLPTGKSQAQNRHFLIFVQISRRQGAAGR